jgi:hypothetical protein
MANPNPSPETRFKKGEVANPEGVKGHRLAERLRRMEEELITTKDGMTLTRADARCRVLYKLAIDDEDIDAIKYIDDRVYGRVVDKHHIAGMDIGPMTVRFVNDWRAHHRLPSLLGESNGESSD